MKKIISILLLICFSTLLCSCGQNSLKSEENADRSVIPISANPASKNESEQTNLQMIVSGNGMMFHIVDSTDNMTYGFSRRDKGADITYYDHATMTWGLLRDYLKSDDPNCAFLGEASGAISPIVIGDELFFFKSGDTNTLGYEGTGSYITKIGVSGYQEETIYIDKNDRINMTSGIANDGYDFYFLKLDGNGIDEEPISESLCKTNRAENTIEELETFDGNNKSIVIVGVYSDGLICFEICVPDTLIQENRPFTVNDFIYKPFLYDINTHECKYLNLEWKQGDITIVFDRDSAYYASPKEKQLMQYNLATDETKTLSSHQELDGELYLQGIYGDHILCSVFNEIDNSYYNCGYDLITNEITVLDYKYQDSDGVDFDVTICAESNDFFFVMCGAEYIKKSILIDGEETTYDTRIEKYGLILKDDFWRGECILEQFEVA